jgi:hypothetical protein
MGAAAPSISDACEPPPVEEGLVTRKVEDMHCFDNESSWNG